MDVNDYKQSLKGLLPPGQAFPKDLETNLDVLLMAEAEELARVDVRAQDLLAESHPLTCSETLTDWERVTGLPELCEGLGETLQQRREAVDRKLGTIGGQSPQFYIDTALRLGYVVTITEFRPFRAGVNSAGEPVYNTNWAHAWQVNAPNETVQYFRSGEGAAGEPLAYWGNDLLECVISRLKPAHTEVLFAYSTESELPSNPDLLLQGLDTLPTVVVSTRRLSNTYSGPLMRIRRDSDDSEQDIGYGSDNWLDEAELLSFVGAGDGFITALYDQSGNSNNGLQPTNSKQIPIVISGVVQKVSSKPSPYWDDTKQGFDFPSLTLRQILALSQYDTGVESTFSTLTSLISGDQAFGGMRILGLNGGNIWFTSASFANQQERNNSGSTSTTPLPMPLSSNSFEAASDITQTYYLGYGGGGYTDRNWKGYIPEILMFSSLISEADETTIYTDQQTAFSL